MIYNIYVYVCMYLGRVCVCVCKCLFYMGVRTCACSAFSSQKRALDPLDGCERLS